MPVFFTSFVWENLAFQKTIRNKRVMYGFQEKIP